MPEDQGGVRGYVLAGGRSSRMGVDKAGLRIGGRTLLEIAAEKLGLVCGEVVVVGERRGMLPGLRFVPDLHPGCGPVGGMEASLRDLRETAGEQPGEWAAFLPVDMPFLPAGLVRELVCEWMVRSREGMRVGMVEADGRMQPLLSLVHRDLLSAIERSLADAEWKVRAVLEGGAGQIASEEGSNGRLFVTPLSVEEMRGGRGGWVPSAAEWEARSLWFGNLNTPEEFAAAEEFAGALTGQGLLARGPEEHRPGVPQEGMGE